MVARDCICSLHSLFALLLVLTGVGAEVVAPLFMWSPHGYFTHSRCQQREFGEVVSSDDLASGIPGLGASSRGQGALNSLVHDSSKPEAIVAFVYSKGELSHDVSTRGLIEELLASSTSCVSIPFVEARKDLTQSLTSAVQGSAQAQVLSLGSSTCDAVLDQLRAASLFSNGATDLIILQQPDGSCVKRVIELVTSKQQRVVFAATEEPTTIVTEVSCEVEPRKYRSSRVLLEDQVAPPTNSTSAPLQYISTPILMGLMLAFVLLLFLFIGVGCLMSIDAPQRFATEPLPVPKEY